MKNKTKLLLFIIAFSIIIILLTITVQYLTTPKTPLILDCDQKKLQSGKDLTCTIYGYQKEYEVSALTTTVEVSDNLEIAKITPDKSFEGDGENDILMLYTDKNKKDKFPIATVVISVKNNNQNKATIKLKDNTFFDETFKEHKLEEQNKELVVK